MQKCSIIMYHYVRELPYTRYPAIKGLKTSLFKEQLAYMSKHYTFVCAKDLMEAAWNGAELPENAAWLTFDDAYADHYTNVFPILDEMGIEGAFFPPVKAITEHEVLDVNKIHFILAANEDVRPLVADIYRLLDEHREAYRLESNDHYYRKLAKANRFDPAEVIFIKRLLQVELPENLRNVMTDVLFRKYVSDDEEAFSRELYMNEDQMRCMVRHGMHIGSHGYDHYWLDSLPPDKQRMEVEKSLEFLARIGCDLENWSMAYPYGAYNDSLVEILKEKGCKLGVSTRVDIARISKKNAFSLPRLDTNDLPKDRNAAFVCPVRENE